MGAMHATIKYICLNVILFFLGLVKIQRLGIHLENVQMTASSLLKDFEAK